MPQFEFNITIFDHLPIYIILIFFIIYGLIINRFNISKYLTNNKKKINNLKMIFKNII